MKEKRAAEAALLPVPKNAINLVFDDFNSGRSAYWSDTGFIFAVAQFHFPSPSSAFDQLNDGVLYSSILHNNPSAIRTFAEIVRSGFSIKDN